MSSKKRRGRAKRPAVVAAQGSDWFRQLASGRAVWIFFIVAVLLFYAAPLFDARASVQWDAADYHYSAQKYFSDHLRAGRLPYWTPYPYSGMPFLADVQVGAWYPLNWPFLLAGITPRAIEWEIALHCLLAFAGAFLVARELIGDSTAALFAGALYAFSGFFAAHSSHVGMFQCASLLPWLMWAGMAGLRRLRWLAAVAAIAAGILLAGHFQSALYALTAFGLFLVAHGFHARVPAWRIALVAGCALILPVALTAVQILPGVELALQSNRAAADFSRDAGATLAPGGLLTLADPDHYHAPGVVNYTGPQDITQFYFYQGLLLLPFAALGIAKGKAGRSVLVPAVPALWYAFGPAAGLYLLVARLPGFRSVRAPVHVWFVIALAFAVLAASGVLWLTRRFPYRWLPVALFALLMADLWSWNMKGNNLAYARASFEELYGNQQQRFQNAVESASRDGLRRIWAPFDSPGFGPLNGMLDSRIEVTYGYNPLELARYSAYLEASGQNPRLLDSLGVTDKLDAATGRFHPNPSALPRVTAPASVLTVGSKREAAARLHALDPAREAVVEGRSAVPGGPVQARILAYTGSEYRVAYQAARPALLRIAVPYFPGWRAEVEGRSVPVLPVDLALSGVVVPAGSHELLFRYQSTWFRTGALISAISWLGVALWFAWPLVGRFRAALAASPLPFRVRTRAAFTNSAAESPSPSRNARPG